jgi:hypothetical protein
MTNRKTKTTGRARRTAQLLGGVSIAVLVSCSPALAQAVNITVDRAQLVPLSAFTAANATGYETVSVNTQDTRATVSTSIAGGLLDANLGGTATSAVDIGSNLLSATASGNVFPLGAQ